MFFTNDEYITSVVKLKNGNTIVVTLGMFYNAF